MDRAQNIRRLLVASGLALSPAALAQPLPGPGQTLHWTVGMSPVTVTGKKSVPAGATLIVDAGVAVNVASAAELDVKGTLRFEGTALSPCTLSGSKDIFSPPVVARGGLVQLFHTNATALVATGDATELFSSAGTIDVRNCSFSSQGGIYTRWGTAVIRDTSFVNSVLSLNDSFSFFEGGSLTGTVLKVWRFKYGTPLLVENVNASGNAASAPFFVESFDILLGEGNTIQGNKYPVELAGGGLHPGSVLPASGNTNNHVWIPQGKAGGRVHWPKHALDYVIGHDPNTVAEVGGSIVLEPGVNLRFMPDAYLWATFGAGVRAFGTPTAPITFMPHLPGAQWLTLNFAINSTRPHLRNCIIRGSELGLIADETIVRIDSTLFENNTRASYTSNFGGTILRGSRLINNTLGMTTSSASLGSGLIDADGKWNPNWFQGNGTAILIPTAKTHNAKNNYWGHPSGPKHPVQNPQGQGDPVTQNAFVDPWRTAEPAQNDHPPQVEVEPVAFLQEGGKKLLLHWTASDDVGIAVQRVHFGAHGEAVPMQLLINDIDPQARSIEVPVPAYVPSSSIDPPVLRVEVVDIKGQIGFDEVRFFTPNIDFNGRVYPNAIAGPFKPGQTGQVCYSVQNGATGTTDVYLFLDSEDWAISLGGAHTGVPCLPLGLGAPPISTDLARVGVRFNSGAGGRNDWQFTPYFSIRPDAAIGDAPPSVSVLAPSAGALLSAGQLVNIQWNASDDDLVRKATIQITTDGGRTWDTIARGVQGSSYPWRVPANTGVPQAQLRVIVFDKNFQSTAATSGVFSLDSQGVCYPDCDASSTLDIFDYICFGNAYAAQQQYADCDQSGSFNVFDYICFGNAYAAGCP